MCKFLFQIICINCDDQIEKNDDEEETYVGKKIVEHREALAKQLISQIGFERASKKMDIEPLELVDIVPNSNPKNRSKTNASRFSKQENFEDQEQDTDNQEAGFSVIDDANVQTPKRRQLRSKSSRTGVEEDFKDI